MHIKYSLSNTFNICVSKFPLWINKIWVHLEFHSFKYCVPKAALVQDICMGPVIYHVNLIFLNNQICMLFPWWKHNWQTKVSLFILNMCYRVVVLKKKKKFCGNWIMMLNSVFVSRGGATKLVSEGWFLIQVCRGSQSEGLNLL